MYSRIIGLIVGTFMVMGSVLLLLNMKVEHVMNPFTYAFCLIVGFTGEYLIYHAFSRRNQ